MYAIKETIDNILYSLDNVESIRLYHNPVRLLDKYEDQRDWAELIFDDINIDLGDASVVVSLLDMGVNNGHMLLKDVLPDEHCVSVVSGVGAGHEGSHGTGMAGLIEYGDLNDYAKGGGRKEIKHTLVSIKLLSDERENEPALYGILTKNAIEQSGEMGASIICMAVTEDVERNSGLPTSWSAEIDRALYNDNACDKLMLISVGNTQADIIDHEDYLTSLVSSSAQSPAQALNAVAVGSYTEMTHTGNNAYKAIAPPSGISPMTRTTFLWRGKNVKPDIVMEGGNYAHHGILGNINMSELSLVTTSEEIPQKPLQSFCATSASTALATNLAAMIKNANPELSMLSVRALMIHSAEWTPEMLKLGHKVSDIMKYCGYGVPQVGKAIASDDHNATFVFENELVPYSDKGTYYEMHFYELPWPKELLVRMHGEKVRLRATLSYYIEPSPGNKSVYNKYRYPSSSLSFDVKHAGESREQFIARNNRDFPVEVTSKNDSNRWKVGIRQRAARTVQSDWFECSALELAECNEIGVFPGNGWWKSRKIANVGNIIKYSLVVTISTAETEIYESVKMAIQTPVEIAID